ncbi:MAG: hypothetical protein IJB33_05090 [Akkermansia sp.]|nr:hypothetical protein [Akkermansia sp.]
MSLRDKLEEILPDLLPTRAEEAIKGTELIARVRAVLGDSYSDRSLRSQFSFIALEPDSCLARVPNGQGYYLRGEAEVPSLHNVFTDEADGDAPLHKAFALAVRLYDTAGLGVFAYPPDEDSWEHPDLVAVQWPTGTTTPDGAYIIDPTAPQQPAYRSVCVAPAEDAEECRRAFFRTLACGLWAQEAELLIVGDDAEAAEELTRLAAQFGVGVRTLAANDEVLTELPRADEIFRAPAADARAMLADLQQPALAHPRYRSQPLQTEEYMPATAAARQWAEGCIARGRIEPWEHRVAVN